MNLRIEPQAPRSLEVPFKVADMSYKNLLSGFGDPNYLIMTITYDDSNDRVISYLAPKVKIKVRPSGRVLFVSMLIGVVVGTVLKFVLQRLQRKGIISRREAVWFAGSTVFIGLVVSIIALVGKVKIVFFETTGSYDVPSVIFVVGVVAAVLGAQLLTTWFKTTDQKRATNLQRKKEK
jgi:Kef-type K+ transport system membrane component KefB